MRDIMIAAATVFEKTEKAHIVGVLASFAESELIFFGTTQWVGMETVGLASGSERFDFWQIFELLDERNESGGLCDFAGVERQDERSGWAAIDEPRNLAMIVKISIAQNNIHAAGADVGEKFFGGFLIVVVNANKVRVAFIFGTVKLA